MPLVTLHANLRDLAGRKEIHITGTSVRAVLNELIRLIPPLAEIIFKDGQVRQQVIVTINGHDIEFQNGLDSPTRDHDHIAIFPPLAGG